MKRLIYIAIAVMVAMPLIGCSSSNEVAVEEDNIIFGIRANDYNVERKKVESGELLVKQAYYDVNTGKVTY